MDLTEDYASILADLGQHAVDADGRTLFDIDTGETVDSYPALTDGLLVVGVTDGRLLAIGA